MSKDELNRYEFRIDASEVEDFTEDIESIGDIPGIASKASRFLAGVVELPDIELKHNPDTLRGHSEQQAFYDWMRECSQPEEPWTFPIHDETQGDDWLVVYTKSHFTGMSHVPGGGISISAMMGGREIWFRCPHGMISDDETEAMWLIEKLGIPGVKRDDCG